jgi:nitrite reductase (NADH) large subunit
MRYAIIGNGVAGVTAAQAIKRADAAAQVDVYSAEPYPYYFRPRLWEFIAGQLEADDLYFRPPEWYAERGIGLHLGARVTALDPAAHLLTLRHSPGQGLADGSSAGYDRLLLAMGGQPFVPPFEGTHKAGVFTLRSLDDARAIKEHAQGVSTAVVIGGGLLGLETARALLDRGLSVTVIEFAPYLLPQQLDEPGGRVLEARLRDMGLRLILTNTATQAILGDERATGVRCKSGSSVEGELIIISTGIRPQVELAQQAGLDVQRGVVVDEQLRTSAPDVYAAGDVTEFEGHIYGIIPAALEQARAAAANMVSDGSAVYQGTVPATTLKIVGIDLTSLGDATLNEDQALILRRVDEKTGVYKRLALRDGKLVGAILLGDKSSAPAFKQLITTGRDVSGYTQQLLDENFDLKALARG